MTVAYDPGYGPIVETRVRIATWNLWDRYGPWEARMPVIVENLRAIDADVVALQEAWESGSRSQPHELATELGHSEPVYAANLERDGALRERGAGPVAHLPPRGAGTPPPRRVRHRRRRGRGTPVRLRGDRRAPRPDPGLQRAPELVGGPQRDPPGADGEITRFLTETRPRPFPAVVCGDLNAELPSDELRLLVGLSATPEPGVALRDAWQAAGHADPGYTWSNPTRSPRRTATSTGGSTTSWSGGRSSAESATCSRPGWRGTSPSTACGRRTTSRSSPKLRKLNCNLLTRSRLGMPHRPLVAEDESRVRFPHPEHIFAASRPASATP